jgi:AcrR family transcriptional regulator
MRLITDLALDLCVSSINRQVCIGQGYNRNNRLLFDVQKIEMPRIQTDTRAKILMVANDLFYRHGVRAIGVDTIIAQSEVAKTTLYRYFPSKDDLVVAYLEINDQYFWQLFDQVIAGSPNDPKQKLLTILSWLDQLIASPECYGCPFLMVASEFPEIDYPAHQVAIAHKQKLRDQLTALAELAGIKLAAELSATLSLLIDGTYAQRRLFEKHDHGVTLAKAAQMAIDAYAAGFE